MYNFNDYKPFCCRCHVAEAEWRGLCLFCWWNAPNLNYWVKKAQRIKKAQATP